MNNDIEKKIYSSAVDLFNKHGPKRVSIDMIIKKAWVGKWSFYNYFKNKEDLYEKVFDDIKNFAQDYMDALVEEYPDPKKRFIIDLLNSLDFFCWDSGIIGGLMERNDDYFLWKIDELFLEKTHLQMIKSLFRDVHEEIFSNDEILMHFAGHVFGFYKHAKIMRNNFTNEKDFKDFMTRFAVFLVNGIFSSHFKDLSRVHYSDYIDQASEIEWIKDSNFFKQYT